MSPAAYSYLSHLECTACGLVCDADRPHNLCPACGKVLYARYDLAAVREILPREALAGRRPDMWRYHELLPVRDPAHVLSLGEGMTPLLEAPRLAARFGLRRVLLKDEGKNPTGTFKACGLCAASSRARELGIRAVSMPTAGNAGATLAAYAARGGLTAVIVMPGDTPEINKVECVVYGARAYGIDGLINDAGRVLRKVEPGRGWFDLSTLREPYRVEGKKTMGFEIAEALCWIGDHRPRMTAVQAAGCAPIVRAYREGKDRAEPFENAHTVASGLRVPVAVGDYLMLRVVRESGGTAVDVTDAELLAAMRDLAETEGVFAAPEAAATLAALPKLADAGAIRPDDEVLLLLTGAGMKYTDLLPSRLQAWSG